MHVCLNQIMRGALHLPVKQTLQHWRLCKSSKGRQQSNVNVAASAFHIYIPYLRFHGRLEKFAEIRREKQLPNLQPSSHCTSQQKWLPS